MLQLVRAREETQKVRMLSTLCIPVGGTPSKEPLQYYPDCICKNQLVMYYCRRLKELYPVIKTLLGLDIVVQPDLDLTLGRPRIN